MKYDAIYTRVSSKQQDTRSQQLELKAWERDHSGGVPIRWFSDTFTGRKMNRPAWEKLYAEIQANRIRQLVVWRLDRLGRTASGLTQLFDELNERDINLVSLKDGIDLSTPAGRLMANVIASVAQYETEIRGERVRAGQDAAKAAGKRWGGSVAGIRKKVTPLKERIIVEMYEKNQPISQIADAVGLSRPTVYDVLRAAEAMPC